MKQKVYLLIGVPGSGKSWTAAQLGHKLNYVHHDGFIGHINQPDVYAEAILAAADTSSRPILAEAPFSISSIKDPLEANGINVVPVVIVEKPEVVEARYKNDKNRVQNISHLPGHIKRMKTYEARAKQFGWFHGTTDEVLDYLRNV